MARHIHFIEKHLAATEPLANYLKADGKRAEEARGPGKVKSLKAAKGFLRDKAVSTYHFARTFSMISREVGGVVGPQLRLYGTINSCMCDASIIPLTPRANPQATSMESRGTRLA